MATNDQTVADPVAAAVNAAYAALAARVDEINDLNVFPVADGDTGTNMVTTLKAAATSSQETPNGDRADFVARAVLLAARGNSGMILSQLIRGAAEAISGQGELTGDTARRALRGASDAGYAAVREPVEGTMLTVARRIAEAAERTALDSDFLDVLRQALAGGWSAVEETTDLLPQLQQAKVVDSGGLGVAVILDAIVAHLDGRPPAVPAETAQISVSANDHPPSRFRYCTSFVLEGDGMDLAALEEELIPLGDSLLVLGDESQAKVHIHTDEPARAVSAGEATGTVQGLNVDDMREQEAERSARIAKRLGRTASDSPALAIVATEQLGRIAESLGAGAMVAGHDLVEQLAAALSQEEAPRIVVAEAATADDISEVAKEHSASVLVAPSLPALLGCLVAFDVNVDTAANLAEMEDLGAEIVAAEVTGSSDPKADLQREVSSLVDGGAGLVTVLIGTSVDAPPNDVEDWVREVAPKVEVEAHRSGLEHPTFAIGAE